jgi:hypothetical protein
MISRMALAAVVFLVFISGGVAQQAADSEPYNDADAYEIYSVLLPHEAYGDMVVIQEETVQELQQPGLHTGPEDCLFPEAASRFQDAVSDYKRRNQKIWRLQRKFQLEKPYEIVNRDTLEVLADTRNWDGFYKRYPNSGGFLVMSAVGFNKEKTRAIVYLGRSCGSLCGEWRFRLLEKVDAKWREVRGVSCSTIS